MERMPGDLSLGCLALMFAIATLPVWRSWLRRQRVDVFEPVWAITVHYVLLFGVQPFFLMLQDAGLSTSWLFLKAITVGILGLLSFYGGYYSQFGRAFGQYIPSFRADWSGKRLLVVVAGLVTLSALALLWLLKVAAREENLWEVLCHPLEFNNRYLKSNTGYLIWGLLMLQQAFFLAYTFCVSFRKYYLKVLVLALALPVLVIYLQMGTRWLLLMCLLVPMVVKHYHLGARLRVPLAILGGVLLVLVLGILNNYRAGIGIGILSYSLWHWFLGTLCGDLLTPFNNFVELIRSLEAGLVRYLYGRYYLYLLVLPVPRIIWPTKPVVSVEWAFTTEVFGIDPREGPTYTMTIPGDLYYNFGLPGVVVGMYLLGIFWRAAYMWLARNRSNLGVVLVYAVFFLTGVNCLRTSLQTFIISGLTSSAPLCVALTYAGRGIARGKRRNPPGARIAHICIRNGPPK
jgi:oligosaccharide repeat unit polymerase